MTIEDLTTIKQVSLGVAGGAAAVVTAFYFWYKITAMNIMDEIPADRAAEARVEYGRLQELQKRVADGAKAFLHAEYKYLAVFALTLAIAIAVALIRDNNDLFGFYTMICYLIGSTLSAGAGYIGMLVATETNMRTAVRCTQSMKEGLSIAFASGAVLANAVVGFSLLGLAALYLIFRNHDDAWNYLSGFGFGGSSVALFARVGGGIFTKAADVGADLVGKVEQNIPEDDARNPAVVADNVGDNVGDVAGMGADLFESYAGSLIAAATLAKEFSADPEVQRAAIALPFWILGFGAVMSLVGISVVRFVPIANNASLHRLLQQINFGILTASILEVGFTILCCLVLFESETGWRLFGCTIIGLAAGIIIGQFTEYCTSYDQPPTRDISAAALYGPAPVIIKGLGVGMMSTTVPTLAIAITILACNELAGLYGIALAAVGLLSTLGITLATDAFGPVADNAGGLAEMAGFPAHIRDRTDALDSLGNTTAATGKGFAIGSAVLTSAGLIVSFLQEVGLRFNDTNTPIIYLPILTDAITIAGLIIGSMLPFVFSALTMLSVDKAARSIIREVRLQFAQCPELLNEENKFNIIKKTVDGVERTYPDTQACVGIATQAAIEEMLLPGVLAVFAPICCGFLLGPKGLSGLLFGSLCSGFMLALTMANAGGAWDNAKKYVEKCASEGEVLADGTTTYTTFGVKKSSTVAKVVGTDAAKLSQFYVAGATIPGAVSDEVIAELNAELGELYHERHSAVVIGDTVGDPFKDTSGPAVNILIKLTAFVSLMIAPAWKSMNEPEGFGKNGWWISLVVAVVVTIIMYFILSAFAKRADAHEKAALEAVRKARLAHQGAAAPAAADATPAAATAAAAAAAAPVAAADIELAPAGGAAAPAEETSAAETA